MICSKLMGCEGLPGCCSVRLCKISLEDGRFGPMGVDLMFTSFLSIVLPDALGILSAVFMVFTWHSMYPCALG